MPVTYCDVCDVMLLLAASTHFASCRDYHTSSGAEINTIERDNTTASYVAHTPLSAASLSDKALLCGGLPRSSPETDIG